MALEMVAGVGGGAIENVSIHGDQLPPLRAKVIQRLLAHGVGFDHFVFIPSRYLSPAYEE